MLEDVGETLLLLYVHAVTSNVTVEARAINRRRDCLIAPPGLPRPICPDHSASLDRRPDRAEQSNDPDTIPLLGSVPGS